jgi:predicted kinase
MEAVLLIGIQASGKSGFYRERFAATHTHISLDEAGARQRERRLLAGCLSSGRPFVVDNTNVTAAERRPYIEAARNAGYRVTGYFFDTALKAAIARNARRPPGRKVPVPAVVRAFKRLEPPDLSEGFDRLVTVRLSPDDRFTVDPCAGPDRDRQ